MWNALTNRLPTNMTKLLALCMIPVLYQTAVTAVGSVSIHVDPGNLDSTKGLKKIEEERPEITYIRIPEEYDAREKKNIDKFIETLNSRRHTVVIADTHHSDRWSHLTLDERKCKGDLSFFSNNRTILEQLYEWSYEDEENGIPKCAEHTEDPSFADLLKGIAEDSRLDGLCSTAFVGSPEEESEPKETKDSN